MRRISRAACLSVCLLLVTAAPAAATAATADRVRALASAAASGDARSLDALRQVDRVDGQRVDLGRALDADGGVLRSRLRVLAGPSGAAPVRDAREQADQVLAGRRFHDPSHPRPLAGLLRSVGRLVRPLGRPFAAVGRALGRLGTIEQVVLALAVVAAAAAAAVWSLSRFRSPVAMGRVGGGLAAEDVDPRELDADAERAELEGRLDDAVRLRFVAGLVRLDRAGRVTFRPSLTAGEASRAVASPTLARLARDFDEIAYGRRPAAADDVAASRQGWPRALAEAGVRS